MTTRRPCATSARRLLVALMLISQLKLAEKGWAISAGFTRLINLSATMNGRALAGALCRWDTYQPATCCATFSLQEAYTYNPIPAARCPLRAILRCAQDDRLKG